MGSGLADPILHDHESLDSSLLPQSIIYNRSCTRFSKPVLTPAGDVEEIITRRNVRVKDTFECIMRCQRYCKSIIQYFDRVHGLVFEFLNVVRVCMGWFWAKSGPKYEISGFEVLKTGPVMFRFLRFWFF